MTVTVRECDKYILMVVIHYRTNLIFSFYFKTCQVKPSLAFNSFYEYTILGNLCLKKLKYINMEKLLMCIPLQPSTNSCPLCSSIPDILFSKPQTLTYNNYTTACSRSINHTGISKFTKYTFSLLGVGP